MQPKHICLFDKNLSIKSNAKIQVDSAFLLIILVPHLPFDLHFLQLKEKLIKELLLLTIKKSTETTGGTQTKKLCKLSGISIKDKNKFIIKNSAYETLNKYLKNLLIIKKDINVIMIHNMFKDTDANILKLFINKSNLKLFQPFKKYGNF